MSHHRGIPPTPIRPIRIGRETADLAQTPDPAQQELQLPIRRAGRILRDHVAAQLGRDERQAALRVGGAEDAGAGQGGRVGEGVVGHVEVVGGGGPKALGAVPGHVLDHEEGAVGDEDVVERAVADDGPVQPLDHGRQDGEAARRGIVRLEHPRGAFLPGHEGRVDGLLDVRAVEVDLRPCGEVVEGAREPEDVPE